MTSGSDNQQLGEPRPLDFCTYLLSLGSSALVQLGQAPDPGDGKVRRDLPGARQTIALLGVLQTKTEGNLEDGETRLLKNLLSDLRSRYEKADRS